LYTTSAARPILLFTARTFLFTLTRTAAESPSGLSDWNDSNAFSFHRFAENGRRSRNRAEFLSHCANESLC
jgi:hypothetical protein